MKAVKMKLDSKMYILCVFYFFVIALCACVSGYMLYLTHSLTFIITTIASVVFVISDSVLAFVYFTPVKRRTRSLQSSLRHTTPVRYSWRRRCI